MALKDMLALVDDKLKEVFSTPAYDEVAARKPVLAGIAKAKEQFEAGKTKVPHRWWSAANNVVLFKPRLGGNALLINGKEESAIPAERFPAFLDHFTAAVNAGEFDEEIKNHGKGTAKVTTPRAPRAKREGGGSGWSEERRARFAASIAARNANKGKDD